MAFNGSEGGQISLEYGAELTAGYRTKNPNGTKGHFFGRDILESILSQNDCQGIRIYYGMDAENDDKQELVIVGANSDENDILELIGDLSIPCPNRCSNGNALNGNR